MLYITFIIRKHQKNLCYSKPNFDASFRDFLLNTKLLQKRRFFQPKTNYEIFFTKKNNELCPGNFPSFVWYFPWENCWNRKKKIRKKLFLKKREKHKKIGSEKTRRCFETMNLKFELYLILILNRNINFNK